MIKFPSIDQFRQTIREVKTNHDYKGKAEDESPIYLHDSPYPVIEFTGTVKLHGTNASIAKYKDGRLEYQSRERVLDLQHDNAGFMLAMSNKDLNPLFDQYDFADHVVIFGEWCGQGIQKGVAISELPKLFVVFGIRVDDQWVSFDHIDFSILNIDRVFSIYQFPTFKVAIDFNSPELIQNELIGITEGVEKECPVGKYFDISGVGEGVVWKAKHNDRFYQFKVKGEKHSISKVKTLASVDIEMISSINEFVDDVLTDQRLEQGVTWLRENQKEVSQKSTGDYLRWLVNDVIKEETDTIVGNQLDPKKINSAISAKARVWFFSYLDREVFAER